MLRVNDIDVQQLYHYLDKLFNVHKPVVQQISYQHTLQILNNSISIVFYHVTTLYFESDTEDEEEMLDIAESWRPYRTIHQ